MRLLLAAALLAAAGAAGAEPKKRSASPARDGLELYYRGDEDSALRKLEQAVAAHPGDAKARRALRELNDVRRREDSRRRYADGLRAFYRGDTQNAQQKFLLALELDQDNARARAALERLERPAPPRR